MEAPEEEKYNAIDRQNDMLEDIAADVSTIKVIIILLMVVVFLIMLMYSGFLFYLFIYPGRPVS